MFAAVGGLAYSIGAFLKLQGYLGYIMPLPIVLAALHSGPAAARKTTTATAVLLVGEILAMVICGVEEGWVSF